MGKAGQIVGGLGPHFMLYIFLGILGLGVLVHLNTNANSGLNPGMITAEGAWDVVTSALAIESHLAGDRLQQFMVGGPPDVQKVTTFWQQHNKDLNNIQCGDSVYMSYYMAGHPFTNVPFAFDSAINYWKTFQPNTGSDWQQIPVGQAPLPGDIMVWDDGVDGHVAVVVNVNQAQGSTPANVIVAQANSPAIFIGNGYTDFVTPNHQEWIPWLTTPGIHLGEMDMTPDYHIRTWPGYTVVGLLRDPMLLTMGLQTGNTNLLIGLNVTLPPGLNSPYVSVAEAAAAKYGYNPILFVRQINLESGFNPNAISPAGAAGIAQFEPGTAPGWGIRVDNSQDDKPHPCSSAGLNNQLSSYLCDERFDAVMSLDAAARMMLASYNNYLGSGTAQGQIEAYKMALAAYNCGGGCVTTSINQGGMNWKQHLPAETQNYILNITGSL